MFKVKKYFFRTFLLMCFHQLTEAAWLRCYKGSLEEFVVVPLEKSLPRPFIDCIDRNIPTMVYVFGYRGLVSGPATTAMLSAYIATKKRNVILLDWEEEAQSGLLGISLGYALSAVPHARKIGKKLGVALVSLAEAGVNMTNIHLVGHSLGAHIMAFAGKEAREQGHVVSRITGLDPARALFEGSFAVQSGLDRTCARFVDIIHSDPGGYGTSVSTGTVDIWPNYTGKKATQPGCETGDFEMFSREDLCKHDRSWMYYVEALSSPTSFPAVYAPDYETWASGNVDYSKTIFLGELTSSRATGDYFLTTNAHSPYGRGTEGLKPNEDQSSTARQPRESTITRLLRYFR
ncbi:hypothetical protein K1T71_008685 [Dendrolimus kikuchii]|uniref:Uncharacterized protein n=1 Tax=Dendrolimus kikuchii TaxID=765133 RepID=A0ACC1CVB5_9NEOP|nr:hypothetical protein K1T71_008685 [Dendrolimus kikuchii]